MTKHVSPGSASAYEPIAIVGIGCRFPGSANSPDAFWRILRDGTDVVREVPPDRWNADAFYDPEPGTPGRTNAREGGFIEGIDQFDASFFGISPREARSMDPQQRLLLEVAWEALEDAGQPADRLKKSNTGVFVGISSHDYAFLNSTGDLGGIDTYTNTGGAMSIAANRISYCFDFVGPSIAVDTACSSSLVAVHLACQNLHEGNCPVALAGGVNVLIKPEPFIGFSRLSMLSPDCRCKAFDAGANGFVRAEGAGMVVLKRLSDAVRQGDRIYAVIRSTAVNQDGHTNGLTVPSQEAQEELVREACRQAGIEPAAIQFAEAHGTGTLVGDPIEARALGNVLAEGRSAEEPCALGSVKTNIGHLEPAAGIAGLIKVALALRHQTIPPNLHFHSPNPQIDFDALKLRVPSELAAWPDRRGRRLAALNSFGFGGTNAHAILEDYHPHNSSGRHAAETNGNGQFHSQNGKSVSSAVELKYEERPWLLPLSAKSAAALRQQARRVAEWLREGDAGETPDWRDVCSTAALRRAHHDHRLAVIAADGAEAADALTAFAEGKPHPAVLHGRVSTGDGARIAFVFSGQGPQWWGMGRQLLQSEPVFRQVLDDCDRVMAAEGCSWSLLEELAADEETSRVGETEFAQPMIFAVQVALLKLWQSWGIEPDAVVGHSVGEVAAAYACGALSFEDAVRVIYHRGRCMGLAQRGGRMLAAGLAADAAEALVSPYDGRISLAAVNSPTSVTLSGDGDALEAIARTLDEQDVFNRFLKVSHAFHSRHMDAARSALAEALADLRTDTADLPVYSTVLGAAFDGAGFNAEYWWQNVRQGVRFAPAIGALLDDGYDTFVEISPHPVLVGNLGECADARQQRVTALHSLRRKEDERRALLKAVGGLYVVGRQPDWNEVAPQQGRFMPLPGYPWQHESFWKEAADSKERRIGSPPHPLLGRRSPGAVPLWQNEIDVRVVRYLRDHRVQGHVLLSGTSYIEMALAAAHEQHGAGPYLVEEVEFQRACFLPDEASVLVQLTLDPETSSFHIASRPEAEGPWTRHVTGEVRAAESLAAPPAVDLEQFRGRFASERSGEECYALLQKAGLEYGPTFQGIEKYWPKQGEALAVVAAPQGLDSPARYQSHPALLDACLQAIICALEGEDRAPDESPGVYLPVAVRQVRAYRPVPGRVWAHARLLHRDHAGLLADVTVYDDSGMPVIDVVGISCQAVDGPREKHDDEVDELVYAYRWRLQPRPGQAEHARSAAHLPAPGEVLDVTRAEAERLIQKLDLVEQGRELQTHFDGLCAAYILTAFRKLGVELAPGDRFTTSEMSDRLDIVDHYRRLMHRYLEILAEDGWLSDEGDAWQVVRRPKFDDPNETWQQLMTTRPSFYAELTLIGRCGSHLAEILRGDVDPLQLIFPDGSLAVTEHLYQDSPLLRLYNSVAQRAIAEIGERLPDDRVLRVLEIGAGTGGLTTYALARLPADRTEYVFTDLSNHFFLKAQEKFADYPFVEYKRLDIENDPLAQDFAPHSFDLIIASEVLHATRDLRETLEHVRDLIASDGLLLLLEAVRPVRWIDMVFSLTDGWWRFTDTDLRPTYPLLSLEKWRTLLEQLGFHDVREASGLDERHVENGVILARASRFAAVANHRRATPEADPPGDTAVNADADAEPIVDEAAARSWLVLADRSGLGRRMVERLEARGDECLIVEASDEFREIDEATFTVDVSDSECMRSLCDRLLAGRAGGLYGIIHLWNCDVPEFETADDAVIEQAMQAACLGLLPWIAGLSESTIDPAPRLWLVSRGSESVGKVASATNPLGAGLWGFGRVSRSEVPKLRTTLVDLSRDVSDAEIESFGEELRADSPEDEIALRGAARYVHRYVRCAESESAECLLPVRFGTTAYRLETGRSNTFDQLALRECDRVVPGPGQVEIRVAASGLNFSDVMKALGIYPGLPAGPVPLGIECSGTIVAVGPGVTAWTPDDEVVALAGFTFGAYTTTDARFVARKPPHLNFEEAATLPVTYLTAHYALSHLGNMRPGHRVLIHAATGGVGMAAVHLARRAGAEVFATAGTPEKRDLLRSLGIRHVMDSRSLAFADEVLAATDGRGVDLVLNSLAGDAIRKGLSVLADYGRFLEIGKRDIYANSRIGLKPFRKNVSFMAIDLDRSLRDRPDEVAAVFQEVMALCARGEVPSLPLRTFPISRVSAAFRYMAQAKHLGKVVVSVQDDAVRIVPKAKPPVRFRADATYLITGGLGGFGLVVARWMVDNGARHLVLMGRGGVKTEQAQTAVDAMQAAGANVMIGRADVTRPENVERILDEIDGSMPPLRGVMHAAMVLEDCLLSNLNEEITRRVWRPKVTGAWNLHRLTRRRDLDFFVLFSSMASVFGIGGQACYASANACLDSLSYYRQSLGLPGVTISWGSLGEVGWVAEHEDIGSRLETMGVIGFSPRQALTALGRFLQDQPPHVGVMKVDWQRWFEASGAKQLSPKFADLTGGAAGAGQSDTGTGGGSALRSRLLAAGPLERRELLETALCEQIARLLGSTPDKLSLDKPLTDLGLDSLIAVELRNWIEGDLRLNLPIVELMRGPTIARLTDLLVGQLSREKAEPVAEPKSEKKPQEPQPAAEEIPDQTKEAEDASVIAAEMPTPARREPAVPRLTLQQLLSGADQYAQAIEFIRQAGAGVTEQSGHGVDLQKEAQLDSTIRPDSVSPPVASPARALLTGATGYIGAFLLADLLNKTDLEVHCLVRAGDARRAVQRIRDNLGMYDLWRDEFAHRVIPVVGDLGRPRLGLSPAEFDDLAQRIDIVYHAGAAVKFVAPYENLCDINVGGTREVLRFCSRTRCKPLQYISTLAVFSLVDHVELKVPRETDVPRHSGALFTGYPQSKWVAEQLVLEAQRRGLPATIYRLGLVTGHERTGVGNFSDFVSREILTCLQIGMTSDKDCSIDMTPVNYISEAVVALSRSADAAGRVFHLVNEHPMAWGHVFDYVRSRGFKVRSLPYGRWRRELGAHPDFASTPLYELATLFPPLAEDVRLSFPELRFDSSEAVERLAALGIRCPSLDERLLETYLRFAIESGRLPAPERQLSSSAEE